MYSEFGEGATRVRYGRNTAHNIIICIIVMKQWQCGPYYSITLASTLCNVHTTLILVANPGMKYEVFC